MADDWREQHDAAMALQTAALQACRTMREIELVAAAFAAGHAYSTANWREGVEYGRRRLAEAEATTPTLATAAE